MDRDNVVLIAGIVVCVGLFYAGRKIRERAFKKIIDRSRETAKQIENETDASFFDQKIQVEHASV